MKRTTTVLTLCLAVAASTIGGEEACSPRAAQTARDVADGALRGIDLACMLRSTIGDPEALARFCEYSEPLSPTLRRAIEDLVGARDAGRRAGWHPKDEASDAGTDAR